MVPPRHTLATPRGTFKVSNRREIFIYISFISKNLYICQLILKPLYAYMSVINHKNFVIRNFRGTCSSFEVLKGYMLICRNVEDMVRERLGTPALEIRFRTHDRLFVKFIL